MEEESGVTPWRPPEPPTNDAWVSPGATPDAPLYRPAGYPAPPENLSAERAPGEPPVYHPPPSAAPPPAVQNPAVQNPAEAVPPSGPAAHPMPPPYAPAYAMPPAPSRRHAVLPAPVAIQPVPGTPFALAIVGVAATPSGPATASLLVGMGSILVSLVVGCFGTLGATDGWGPTVSGAFAVLATLAGAAALALGQVALRQVRRGAGSVTGRGLGIAGIICGAVGLCLTAVAFVYALAQAA